MTDIYEQAAKAHALWLAEQEKMEDGCGDPLAWETVRAQFHALAPAMADELLRMREGITLIERINYMEGRDATWRAAKMNAVAYALSNGDDLAPFRRLFPPTAGGTNG